MSFEPPSSLRVLAPRVHAWLPAGQGTWGLANCVLVHGTDSALLVDTPYTADLTRHLIGLADAVTAGTPVGTVVNTHGNGDHSYGNALFADSAEIIATEANDQHLCVEPPPEMLAALIAAGDPATPLGAYMRRHFGRFGDFGLTGIAKPTRTFSGRLDLEVGGVQVRLIEAGPAHTAGDLIVHLPEEGVVCAGDVVFGGDHPVHWVGPLEQVHRAVTQVLACDPQVVVPGHGPLMTPAEVRDYADYLLEVREVLHGAHAAGKPVEVAAAELVAAKLRPGWSLPERQALLAAVEYRALNKDATALDLAGLLQFSVGFTEEGPDGGAEEGPVAAELAD